MWVQGAQGKEQDGIPLPAGVYLRHYPVKQAIKVKWTQNCESILLEGEQTWIAAKQHRHREHVCP